MKKETKKIKLSILIAKSIFSRQAIRLIKDEIFTFLNYKKTDIILDFNNVDFISRSFADEILELQEQMKKEEISLSLINKNDEIENMLEITSFQRKNKIRRNIKLKAVNLEEVIYQF